MQPERTVRQATEKDIDRIAEILVEVELVNDAEIAARVRSCMERSPDTCFVSETEDVVDGVLLSSFNGFHLFLSHFAVAPSQKETGVGRALHDRLIARGKEINAIGIITDSWLTSTGFYYKLGYRLPGAVFLIKDIHREAD